MIGTDESMTTTPLSATGMTRFYGDVGKSAFDVIFAVLLLPVIVPIIAVIWCLIRYEGGAVFFAHTRIGAGGRAFKCWKIRTMLPDAESRLRSHLRADPAAAAEWARDHKLRDDPRITRLGRLLRRTSLDELPQIWNVLRGDMSFVGPRPIVRAELHKYKTHRGGYLQMKPGITGLWQVSGRNDITYDERVAMDMAYARRQGFWLDLKIIAMTGGAMLHRTGK